MAKEVPEEVVTCLSILRSGNRGLFQSYLTEHPEIRKYAPLVRLLASAGAVRLSPDFNSKLRGLLKERWDSEGE